MENYSVYLKSIYPSELYLNALIINKFQYTLVDNLLHPSVAAMTSLYSALTLSFVSDYNFKGGYTLNSNCTLKSSTMT